jgi:hypothetical protein
VANIVLFPVIDTIQEFNIQTTNQGAQFGKNPGATVNVVTKSGTDAFHGDLYEFLRNSKLDAANYFDLPGQKPPFHLNQYGGTVGGPIQKNKTFFFAYWDADKVSQGQTYTSTVPTAAERNGDFSQSGTTIYDPQTINMATGLKQPFLSDTIPAGRISAPALALTNINYPLPDRPGLVNNFVWNPLRTQNGASFGVRIDHQFSTKDYVFSNFMYQDFTLGDPSQLFDPLLADPSVGISKEITSVSETMNVRGDQVGWTHTFSPTLVADTHLGFTREYELIPNPLYKTVGLSTALGIPGVNPPYNTAPYTQGLSDFGITGYTSLGEPTTPPFMVGDTNFEGIEDMTWIKGKHTIDFGGDAIKRYYNYFQSPTQRGAWSFTGTYTSQLGVTGTGNGYADLLLGIPETLSSAVFSNLSGQRQWESGLYFQDAYHATSKLTLTLGTRYDLLMPRVEEYNRQGNLIRRYRAAQSFWPAPPLLPAIAPCAVLIGPMSRPAPLSHTSSIIKLWSARDLASSMTITRSMGLAALPQDSCSFRPFIAERLSPTLSPHQLTRCQPASFPPSSPSHPFRWSTATFTP